MEKLYFARLTRAAHWYLPPAEAEDVLSDYRDMFAEKPRTDSELYMDLGTPQKAIRLVAQPQTYRRWLAVFAALAACVLLPAAAPFLPGLWRFCMALPLPAEGLFMGGGLVLSFAWFQRQGVRKRPLAKGLLVLLAALTALAAGAGVWMAWVMGQTAQPAWLAPATIGSVTGGLLELLGVLAGLAGLLGLVQARMSDRRWRALYVLGLTVAVLCLSMLSVLRSMSLDGVSLLDLYPWYWAALGGFGLLGAGVSLC